MTSIVAPETMEFDLIIEDDRWADCALDDLCARAGIEIVEALALEGDFEVSLLAADDARIAALNSEFRGKPDATNVLSWPSVDLAPKDPGAGPNLAAAEPELGDIALAYETCAQEAAEQGKRFEDHISHLLVHGVLHLLGFDHINDQDAALMEALESRILAKLGISDPYQV